jgi:hypothetical protein
MRITTNIMMRPTAMTAHGTTRSGIAHDSFDSLFAMGAPRRNPRAEGIARSGFGHPGQAAAVARDPEICRRHRPARQ